jgi:hypothetical protein
MVFRHYGNAILPRQRHLQLGGGCMAAIMLVAISDTAVLCNHAARRTVVSLNRAQGAHNPGKVMTTTSTSAPSSNTSDSRMAALEAENQQLKEALFGRHGVVIGLAILEKNLNVATRAKHEDAPFPMDQEQARIWHQAGRSAYCHALEMLNCDTLRELAVKMGYRDYTVGQVEPEAAPAAAPGM